MNLNQERREYTRTSLAKKQEVGVLNLLFVEW